jgi:hypothetical protein
MVVTTSTTAATPLADLEPAGRVSGDRGRPGWCDEVARRRNELQSRDDPDPTQAKSNTSGKTRTTVQAQTAYTMR